jgi:hypothetical protein
MKKQVLYFSDYAGETVELIGFVSGMVMREFDALFPGIRGRRFDSYSMQVGRAADGRILPVMRVIEYSARPSLHFCDARCMSARGPNCECSCGGKNHGAGFTIAASMPSLF